MSPSGWLLDEDRAIKTKLQGLKVADVNNPNRPVKVVYRLPENELSDQQLPMIAIWHTSIDRDPEREQRGPVALQYVPVGGTAAWTDPGNTATSPYVVEMPIPYRINYQIEVVTRKMLHSMSLLSALMAPDRLPARYGFLDIPETSTVRRLDLEGGPDTQEALDRDGKRIFRTQYNISISTEYPPSVGASATKVIADGVNLELVYLQPQYS